MVYLEGAKPRSVLGAPSGGKDGNDPVLDLGEAHLARGPLKTLRIKRKKDPLDFGGFGMGPALLSVKQLPDQVLKNI